jgi:hypothetical protein
MSVTLQPMVIGAKVTFSLDSVDQLPPSATLSSVAFTEISGGAAINIESVGITGTEAIFKVEAMASGTAIFKVVYTFSNGDKDGDLVNVRVL